MYRYIVSENKKITSSTILLTLRRDDFERPMAFQPGQYAAISFEHQSKKAATRCFSIVSSPTEQDILQFSTRVRGHYTKALAKLEIGDIVKVYGPFGGFVFDVTRDKKAILIAGGIGITPFISIYRYLSRLNANNQVTLFYSNQSQDEIAFKDELLHIEREHQNLKTKFVIGHGSIDKIPTNNAIIGSISPDLITAHLKDALDEQKFFICGPPGLMKTINNELIKKGVAKSNILTEAFTQSSPHQTSILRSWPANVYAVTTIGIILGALIITVNDLLMSLPPNTPYKPTSASPFLITTAKKQNLNQLVNTIPPSPNVITPPTATQAPTYSQSPANAQPSSPPPTFAPIYQTAPSPRTTVSAPRP